jgi:outer membrane receptor protein involved in Fe transport
MRALYRCDTNRYWTSKSHSLTMKWLSEGVNMKMPQKSSVQLAVSTALALAAACLSSGRAAAADGESPDASLQEVVVTGSRIARQDYVAQSPIVTTSVESVQNSGVPTVDAYLLQLPQFQPGTGGFTNVSSGGLGVGQATLNLRGLGTVRTLVLLDGRRLQPGNAQSLIDINTIPTSAISDVEVMTGGASATYGSDAMAGVVNFKLRKTFNGLELSSQIGQSDRGDAMTRQFSGIAGTAFADGAGAVMFAADFSDRQPISFRDRAFSTPTGNLAALLGNGYYAPTGSNLPTQDSVNTAFASYGVAAGTVPRTANFGVNPDGTLFRSGAPGTNYRSDGDVCVVANGAAGFGYDGNCTNNLQNGLKRGSGLLRAQYDLSPNVTLFAQGQFAHSFARGQGSHPQATPFGAAGLTVPVTNPFIPADLRALLATRPTPGANFTYLKRIEQDGPRSFTSSTDTYQGVLGAEGKLGSDWSFDAYYSHGNTSPTDKSVAGAVSISALQQLLSAPDGGASLCTGGYNVFGPQPASASCAAFISRRTVTTTNITQDEVALNATGSVWHAPAGDIKLALSGSVRRNKYATTPDPAIQAGDIAAVVAVQPTRGNIRVSEIAAEVLVPLLSEKFLVRSLNFNGGYRYSDYNTSGGVSTYKAGLDWRIVEPLLIRGGYQKAVRAPNIAELFLPAGSVIANIGAPPASGDPCDVRTTLRTGANGAAIRTLCLAQGIPGTIVDTYNQNNVGQPSVTQGNPGLSPETANSYTIGAVIQPAFLGRAAERLNISIDYYNIKIEDTIATLGVQNTLNKCFNLDGSNPGYSATNFFCSLITRNTQNGQISQATQPLLNLGGYRTDGVDAQIDWKAPLDTLGLSSSTSSLIANLTVSYLNKFEIQTQAGSPFQDFTQTIAGSDTYAKWKYSGSIGYEWQRLTVGVRWHRTSAFKDASTVTNPASTILGPSAVDYFDLYGRLGIGEHVEVRAGVTNIGDIEPEQVGALRGFTNPAVYDIIGRAYYLGLKVGF